MRTIEDIECAFPSTLDEALALQADEKTRGTPLGGCTDLIVQWESGVLPMPARAVHIKDVPELRVIAETDEAVTMGGSVTHTELQRSAFVQRHAPALVEAAATIGGFQIQSQGTIAGSIANASPAGDLAPSLLAADCTVVVASAQGEREIPLAEFYLGYRKIDLRPDELIVRFIVPKLPAGAREGFRKLGQRAAQAISKVMGAYRAAVHDGRVERCALALGSVAPTAVRLPRFEAWVQGRMLDDETLREAERRVSDEVTPIDDIRSTADYRKWVSGRIVRGFLETLRG
jgi:CO/xanthine dehydrogenase FAD-binding subunit